MVEAANASSWTELRQNQEIRHLEEMVDSKNILEMEESLAQLRKHNFFLAQKIATYMMRLIDYYHGSTKCGHAVQEWKVKMDYPPSKDTTSCAACSGDTAGEGNYLSNDNLSLFLSSVESYYTFQID